jgi:hypothetical protein
MQYSVELSDQCLSPNDGQSTIYVMPSWIVIQLHASNQWLLLTIRAVVLS